MKCITFNCQNESHQGNGTMIQDEWICAPCLDTVVTGKGRFSQIYRNAIAELTGEKNIANALIGAVHKWRQVAFGNFVDMGTENCPLCRIATKKGKILCANLPCPVYEDTGQPGCEKTPYTEWVRHQKELHNVAQPPYYAKCSQCRSLAQNMADYLDLVRG